MPINSIFVYKCGVVMTKEETDLIKGFETKLHHLLFLYNEVKKENNQLKELLKKNEKETFDITRKYLSLQKDYSYLKTALIINPNRKDIRETKKKLSTLVREVDKCIALLNI